MKNGRQIVYLDTCIYILLLEGDKRDSVLLEGSLHAKERIEKGEVYLVYSDMVILELGKAMLKMGVSEQVEKMLQRSNVVSVAMGRRVTALAGELQKSAGNLGRSIKAPDSVHLATAILYGVDEFYTNNGPLTGLDGHLIRPGMPKICRPPLPKQLNLGMSLS